MRVTLSDVVSIDRTPMVACLDASDIAFPLTIRPVHEGDRFFPLGMKGSKLVSDFLTDLKQSLFKKRRQLVVTDAADRILWLPGLRPDERFRIGEGTRTMLRLEIIGEAQ